MIRIETLAPGDGIKYLPKLRICSVCGFLGRFHVVDCSSCRAWSLRISGGVA